MARKRTEEIVDRAAALAHAGVRDKLGLKAVRIKLDRDAIERLDLTA